MAGQVKLNPLENAILDSYKYINQSDFISYMYKMYINKIHINLENILKLNKTEIKEITDRGMYDLLNPQSISVILS